MSSSPLSGLNLVLLLLTLCALLFGAYGFLGDQWIERDSNLARLDEDADGALAYEREDGCADPCTPGATAGGGERADRESSGKSGYVKRHDPGRTVSGHKVSDTISAEPGEPTDSGAASLTGRVLKPDGSPAAGATVVARRSDLSLTPPTYDGGDLSAYREEIQRFLRKTHSQTRSVTAGKEGGFKFEGLDGTLSYNLNAVLEGAGTASVDRVAAGDSALLLLEPVIALRGVVQGPAGEAVTEFTIKVYRLNRRWEATTKSFENAEGSFSISAPRGQVKVEVTASGYTQEKAVDADVGPSGADLKLVLDRAAILTGTVTDKAGNPLPDATVSVGARPVNRWRSWRNNNQNSSTVQTDSKGRYRFNTLTPKETTVYARFGEKKAEEKTTLTAGENTLNFTIDTGASVVIRLKDPAGNPVDVESIWFQTSSNNWIQPKRLPSKEIGVAEFSGLNAGEYTVTITAGGYPSVKEALELKAGSNEFSYTLSVGATISGTIKSTSGSKITGLRVRLRKEDDKRYNAWSSTHNAQVSEDGSYKVGPVEPGSWLVEVHSTGGRRGWKKVHSETRTFSAGENSLEIVVEGGATLIVRVKDEDGNDVNWARISIRGESTHSGNTQQGVATVSFIDPGSYTVSVSSQGKVSESRGMELQNGDQEVTLVLHKPNCARITRIYKNSQASKAGLEVGDLVFEYNYEKVTAWSRVGPLVRKTQKDDDVTITVQRGTQLMTFQLKGGTIGIDGVDAYR